MSTNVGGGIQRARTGFFYSSKSQNGNNYGRSIKHTGLSHSSSLDSFRDLTSSSNDVPSPSSSPYISTEVATSWIKDELEKRHADYTEYKNIRVLVVTWNVNGRLPMDNSIFALFSRQKDMGKDDQPPDMIIVGFQELDLSPDALLLSTQSSNREAAWTLTIETTLSYVYPQQNYAKMVSKGLVGMLLLLYVRKEIAWRLSEISVSSVGCGILGMLGNKGAVSVRFKMSNLEDHLKHFHNAQGNPADLYPDNGTVFCFVNSHLAADAANLARRNQDFYDICTRLYFYPNESILIGASGSFEDELRSGDESDHVKGRTGSPQSISHRSSSPELAGSEFSNSPSPERPSSGGLSGNQSVSKWNSGSKRDPTLRKHSTLIVTTPSSPTLATDMSLNEATNSGTESDPLPRSDSTVREEMKSSNAQESYPTSRVVKRTLFTPHPSVEEVASVASEERELSPKTSHQDQANSRSPSVSPKLPPRSSPSPQTSYLRSGAPPFSIYDSNYLIWLGDLNYRVVLPLQYSEFRVVETIERGHWEIFLDEDQLRREMLEGRVFYGFKEGPIRFPPSYKFVPYTQEYDLSDRRRLPSWCDRILWQCPSVRPSSPLYEDSRAFLDSSSKSPVPDRADRKHALDQLSYFMVPDVTLSDHKPVVSLFRAKLPIVKKDKFHQLRQELLHEIDKLENHLLPSMSLSSTSVQFNITRGTSGELNKIQDMFIDIENDGAVPVKFYFLPKPWAQSSNRIGQSDRLMGDIFPEWLLVDPAQGYLNIKDSMRLRFSCHLSRDTLQTIESKTSSSTSLFTDSLEDILILHLERGKDHFISVRCSIKSDDEVAKSEGAPGDPVEPSEGGTEHKIEEKDNSDVQESEEQGSLSISSEQETTSNSGLARRGSMSEGLVVVNKVKKLADLFENSARIQDRQPKR